MVTFERKKIEKDRGIERVAEGQSTDSLRKILKYAVVLLILKRWLNLCKNY